MENDNRPVRSASRAFPSPSIIRLKNYISVPFKNIILSRKNILKRDGHRCAYCGKKVSELTLDHILPRSRGGEDTWDNLVACCLRCNNKKGNRTPAESGMKLLVKPYTPDYIMMIKSEMGSRYDEWKPFLFDR